MSVEVLCWTPALQTLCFLFNPFFSVYFNARIWISMGSLWHQQEALSVCENQSIPTNWNEGWGVLNLINISQLPLRTTKPLPFVINYLQKQIYFWANGSQSVLCAQFYGENKINFKADLNPFQPPESMDLFQGEISPGISYFI